MTEAESEMEQGTAKEQSITEAVPQGPGISTKSASTPGTAFNGAGSSAAGAPGLSTIYPTVTSFPPFSGMPGGSPSAALTLPSISPQECRRGIKEPNFSLGIEESKTQNSGRSTNASDRTRLVQHTGNDKLSKLRQPKYLQCQPN